MRADWWWVREFIISLFWPTRVYQVIFSPQKQAAAAAGDGTRQRQHRHSTTEHVIVSDLIISLFIPAPRLSFNFLPRCLTLRLAETMIERLVAGAAKRGRWMWRWWRGGGDVSRCLLYFLSIFSPSVPLINLLSSCLTLRLAASVIKRYRRQRRRWLGWQRVTYLLSLTDAAFTFVFFVIFKYII
jgi:hypothetical protein